jgi:hypothetical protein
MKERGLKFPDSQHLFRAPLESITREWVIIPLVLGTPLWVIAPLEHITREWVIQVSVSP